MSQIAADLHHVSVLHMVLISLQIDLGEKMLVNNVFLFVVLALSLVVTFATVAVSVIINKPFLLGVKMECLQMGYVKNECISKNN